MRGTWLQSFEVWTEDVCGMFAESLGGETFGRIQDQGAWAMIATLAASAAVMYTFPYAFKLPHAASEVSPPLIHPTWSVLHDPGCSQTQLTPRSRPKTLQASRRCLT